MTAQNDELAAPSAGSRFDSGVREAVPMPTDGPDWSATDDTSPRLGPDSLIWKFYGDNRTQLFDSSAPPGSRTASSSSRRACWTTP